MDKFTFLREDLDSLAEGGLSDEEIGLTMLAMARYCMDGTAPDLSDHPGVRMAFAMLRKRLDKYVRKCETNARNGKGGGRPEKTENNPTETEKNPDETENNPTETHDYDYDYDYEQDNEELNPVPPDMDTHTLKQQPDNAPARARPGWFDPAHPQTPDDGAWRYSDKARKATAQRILTYVINSGQLKEQFTVTDAGAIGDDLFEALCAAMKEGLTPRECLQMADDCKKTWQWERDLKEWVVSQGGAADRPEWREQVDELREPRFDYG